MALIVYLDTQDYIKLFNEPPHGPCHQILEQLLDLRDRRHIVIGFSFATVVEFITKPDVDNRAERVRRGQLIKDVCGRNAFPYPTDIVKGATFPNGGMWMCAAEEKIMSGEEFRRRMHATLVEELANEDRLSRKQRRQLGRKSSMTNLIRRLGSTWGRNRSDYGDLPVSEELVQSRIFERFMKGECSDREFETRINAWVSDPAEYSRIIYDYANHPNVLDNIVGQSANDIEKLVSVIHELVETTKELNARLLEIRTNLIDAGANKSDARKLTKQFAIPRPDPDTFGKKLEALLGVGRAGHFEHYVTSITKSGRNFKRSDMMDLFQMCYAYECDLFRCDKDMASIFRDFDPFRNKLVARFDELPDRIDSLING